MLLACLASASSFLMYLGPLRAILSLRDGNVFHQDVPFEPLSALFSMCLINIFYGFVSGNTVVAIAGAAGVILSMGYIYVYISSYH